MNKTCTTVVIAHRQPININQSKVRATLESSSCESSIGNSSVARSAASDSAGGSAKKRGGSASGGNQASRIDGFPLTTCGNDMASNSIRRSQ